MRRKLLEAIILSGALLPAVPVSWAIELGASPTLNQVSKMAADGGFAAGTTSMEHASHFSSREIDGRAPGMVFTGVPGHENDPKYSNMWVLADSRNTRNLTPNKDIPSPQGEDKSPDKGLPGWAVYAGAGVLGALGGLGGGLMGMAAGAGFGLGAAYFYQKGDYGAAFGIMGGAAIGTALGGPIGGLIGTVVGGLIGHFAGNFLKNRKKEKKS